MPGIPPQSGSWILQGLELQSLSWEPDLVAVGKEPLTVCRHEMRHWVAFPSMAVEP